MTKHWGICANVYGDRILRKGAKVVIYFGAGSGTDWLVSGLSKGGRKIEKWVKGKRFKNIRPYYVHKENKRHRYWFETKDEAQEYCDRMKGNK